ncbi:MAG: methyltransferase domain-containing protein [Nanoarchaeota archaeon]|nr:methyltransferase domain-containing protein [Nanoarchaeota archaeon]
MHDKMNLEKVSMMQNYVKWIYDEIKPHLGSNILEVGAGMGAITKLIEKDKSRSITPTDKKEYPRNLSSTKIKKIDITGDISMLENKKFDTIVCVNVLEHIEEDILAIRNMNQLLEEKGKLVIIVPAIKFIYGKIDRADRHWRRYSKQEILSKIKQSQFEITIFKYINFVGVFGWIFQNYILRSQEHRNADLKRFDWACKILPKIESVIKLPIGLNILIVASKKAEMTQRI